MSFFVEVLTFIVITVKLTQMNKIIKFYKWQHCHRGSEFYEKNSWGYNICYDFYVIF